MPKGTSTTRREHFAQIEKTIGRLPSDAVLPKYPQTISYLFSWSCKLLGSEPISYTELYHWSKLTKNDLHPWEVEIIVEIGNIFQSVRSENAIG